MKKTLLEGVHGVCTPAGVKSTLPVCFRRQLPIWCTKHYKPHLSKQTFYCGIDPIHLMSSSEQSLMRHTGGQCHCAIFSEVRFLGDAAFTGKPIAKIVSLAQSPRVTSVQGVNTQPVLFLLIYPLFSGCYGTSADMGVL